MLPNASHVPKGHFARNQTIAESRDAAWDRAFAAFWTDLPAPATIERRRRWAHLVVAVEIRFRRLTNYLVVQHLGWTNTATLWGCRLYGGGWQCLPALLLTGVSPSHFDGACGGPRSCRWCKILTE